MKYIIGIDPGMSGAVAVISKSGAVEVRRRKNNTLADLKAFIESYDLTNTMAYLEQVHAIPGKRMSSSNSFKFGQSYGEYVGLLSGIGVAFQYVRPQRWMKSLSCLTKGDKNVTKKKAQELFPTLTITHDTADALLIAEYGRQIEAVIS